MIIFIISEYVAERGKRVRRRVHKYHVSRAILLVALPYTKELSLSLQSMVSLLHIITLIPIECATLSVVSL